MLSTSGEVTEIVLLKEADWPFGEPGLKVVSVLLCYGPALPVEKYWEWVSEAIEQ